MTKINWAQVNSLLRTAIPFIGGLLVMRGIVSATQFDSLVNQIGTVAKDVTVLIGLLTPIVTAVWGASTHTDAAVVKAAAAVPGVQITVPTDAAPAVLAVAKDESVPNVVTSTVPPKAPISKEQAS